MVTIPEWLRAPIVYTEPGMEGVSVLKDLAYHQVDETVLRMDVYRPPGPARGERRPAVIFVHGDASPEMLVHPRNGAPIPPGVGWPL